jgi:aromatic ring-cleaving dioxygenase
MPVPKTGALPLGDAPADVTLSDERSGAYTGGARRWKGPMGHCATMRYNRAMEDQHIRNFHAHIYFDANELQMAKALAARAHGLFDVAVGHFHLVPVGPHPRGSCQLTVPTDQFGPVASWLALDRGPLTIFAHANTGDDLADHTRHVIWFGESEPLNLAIFS